MGIRYRVMDLPPGRPAAFTPLAGTNPVASSYGLVHIHGSPGNQPVPSPNPMKIWGTNISSDPKTQGSNNSPDVFFPSIYYTTAENMGPDADAGIGMTRRRLTELPIPAVDAQRSAVAAFYRFRAGTTTPTPNRRAFQRWY